MKWAAIILFTSPEACDEFNERHKLQQQFEPQCVLIEDGTSAPRTSLRPKARPTPTKEN